MSATLKILFAIFLSTSAFAQNDQLDHTGVNYNPGPNVKTDMGKKAVDIASSAPDYGWISVMLIGEQRFRKVWGPTFWRMNFAPNTIVALAIGQDVTHKAEFAKETATAGYGSAVEGQGENLGAEGHMAFINEYAATINGQYGSSGSPVVILDSSGNPESIHDVTFIDNGFWTMSVDTRSPVTKTREEIIDWIIENNKDSLRLVMLYGGASRDGFATYVQSKGGKVGTYYDPKLLARTRVPVMKKVGTGGNGQASYPLTKDGKDLYERILGRPLNYIIPQKKPEGFVADIDVARKKLHDEIAKWYGEMAFMEGGIEGSGLVHPGQIGGYDIAHQMVINGKNTVSLRGLQINKNFAIQNDVLVLDFPHPTRMFINGDEWAENEFSKPLKVIKWFMQNEGYRVNTLTEALSDFEKGIPYKFDPAGTDKKTYPFGTPLNRMESKSDAVRAGEQVIIDGSKQKTVFLKKESPYDLTQQIEAMKKEKPFNLPPENELWRMQPQGLEYRYNFDPGPGREFEQLFKSGFPKELIKLQPTTGDFAHYRGYLKGARGLVLFTPTDLTDVLTERAATGDAGQWLHGVMEQRGFGKNYAVIKTAPFMYQPWDPEGWQQIMSQTKDYRKALIQKMAGENVLEFIVVDDPSVLAEVKEILGPNSKLPLISWNRDLSVANSGIEALAESLRFVPEANKAPYKFVRYDIPREHLYLDAHWWEGTSGERVITSSDPKFRGKVFAGVVPDWAAKQKFVPTAERIEEIKQLNVWLNSVPSKTLQLEDCNLFFLDQTKRNLPWNDNSAAK